ncbi:hypothetical protein NMG60_11032998 [Bertholletia excelsa]
MGRRRIEMRAISDKSSRQVTFSKRRAGLFKKANELSSMCSAEVAVIAFSPGGKPFSYGYPNVDSVTSRFLNNQSEAKHAEHDKSVGTDLENMLEDKLKQLEAEKKKGEMLDKLVKPIMMDELGMVELKKLQASMEELRGKVKRRVSEMEASSSLLLLAENPKQEPQG